MVNKKVLRSKHTSLVSPISPDDINLSHSAFFRLTRILAGKIPNKYRTWLMIGTNGFRVGAALYSKVDPDIIKRVNLAYIQAQHYKSRHKQKRILLSPMVGKVEEPILIIDDVIDSGDTILSVRKKIRNAKSDIAVLFRKPRTKVKPDYYLRETDKWIVFPWE